MKNCKICIKQYDKGLLNGKRILLIKLKSIIYYDMDNGNIYNKKTKKMYGFSPQLCLSKVLKLIKHEEFNGGYRLTMNELNALIFIRNMIIDELKLNKTKNIKEILDKYLFLSWVDGYSDCANDNLKQEKENE